MVPKHTDRFRPRFGSCRSPWCCYGHARPTCAKWPPKMSLFACPPSVLATRQDRPEANPSSTSGGRMGGVLRREKMNGGRQPNGALRPLLVVWVVHFWAAFGGGAPAAPADTHEPRYAGFFFGDFFSSRDEHNQNSPTDTANRHCALISTRRKAAVLPAPPPELRAFFSLAAGRSSV